MTTLNELADRLEAASGPDRRLDVQVHIALHPDEQTIVGQKPGRFPREPIYGPLTDFWDWALDETQEPPALPGVQPVTASIDSAMTLVPEGWRLAALCQRDPWFCRLETLDYESVTWGRGSDWITDVVAGQDAKATAATPALALAASALRALSSQTPSGGNK